MLFSRSLRADGRADVRKGAIRKIGVCRKACVKIAYMARRVLVLSLYWQRITAAGALAGGYAGLITSIVLIVLSPSVWVKVLGHVETIFPSDYPTLVTAPLAFVVAITVSLATAPVARMAR